jgi:hypothetical protein
MDEIYKAAARNASPGRTGASSKIDGTQVFSASQAGLVAASLLRNHI